MHDIMHETETSHARQSKPYFRKQTQSWYFSSGGKQHSLGKDKELAFQKFHQLMLNKEDLSSHLSTLYELSQVYLDWVKANREPATYIHHLRYQTWLPSHRVCSTPFVCHQWAHERH